MPEILVSMLAPKFLFLYAYAATAVYVHFRGHVRHRFFRQLSDHSTVTAPYSVLMYAFSAVPNRPYVDLERFPELAPLSKNWQTIRDEAKALIADGHLRAATKNNDIGFHSFFQTGWKRFYVKWYDAPLPSAAALCPRTVALVQSIPSVNAALFALLPPGANSEGIATRSPDRCAITSAFSPRTRPRAGSSSMANLTSGTTARPCSSTRRSSIPRRTGPTCRESFCSATSSGRYRTARSLRSIGGCATR